jgi:hypothetical protein
MDTYGFTPEYITRNGDPWFPVMGEIHYSRYPSEYWNESLLKMKTGGVNVVSAYVIWIHHEEIEGEYDFTGDRDLRRFVETCRECGMSLMLRIGPWSHGEVRNGGFPDWLLKKPFKVRDNDPDYFSAVEKFYRATFAQVEGLLLNDPHIGGRPGPIIGVQIENEFGHCGGLSGEAGEEHMRTLAALARKIGFDVPLYTATGWGGAVTGGLLPVMGGYCEAPWDQRLTDIEPSGNYIFTHERNDHNIGSDFGFGTGITFDMSKFPYLTAELGGGLQVTHHRRPVATARDIGAMSLTKLGSGVNLLGYYMYHGGTNPKGKLSTLQETKASGSINDLPELSYDFRAPIREYGQQSDTYRELKLLTTFLADFGSSLCRMKADLPEANPLFPANSTDLRYSFRHDGERGYLFVNNYQRRQVQASHKAVKISVPASLPATARAEFPPIDVENGDYFFLPFNMPVGNAVLETALVTPLCVLRKARPVYVFYAAYAQAERLLSEGKVDELYQFRGGKKPDDAEVVTLSRSDALDAWKVSEELVIERDDVIFDGASVTVLSRKAGLAVGAVKLASSGATGVYELSIPAWEGEDCFIGINYAGDVARLYENGTLIADNFYLGPDYVWEVGLKRFGRGKAHEFRLEIDPLTDKTPVFLEKWPAFKNGVACELLSVSAELQVSRNVQSH